jgi:peroxiredoxin
MTSTKSLDQVRAELFSAFDQHEWVNYERLTEWLRETDIASNALKVGDTAPDFLLPDWEGRLVSSARLREKGPLVVSFYRGGWCPFCTSELVALQGARAAFDDAGATVVVISPDTMHFPRELRREKGLDLMLLSDVDYGVAISYGLLFPVPDEVRRHYLERGVDIGARHGSPVTMLPVPATYVVRPDGRIVSAFMDVDFTRRQEPEEIVAAVRGAAGA